MNPCNYRNPGIHCIPFYVLVDKEGKVILGSTDDNIIIEKIEEILQ